MTEETNSLLLQVRKAYLALISNLPQGDDGKPVSQKDSKSAQKVLLVVGFSKTLEKKSVKPIRIPLPKPFLKSTDDNLSVCIFTKDPQAKYKEMIKQLGIPSIHKIQSISKLKAKFVPYQAKRNLCQSFDIFLADSNILSQLPKAIGKTFFAKKKQPIPVHIDKKNSDDLKAELSQAIESTYYFLSGGSNSTITVGLTNQSANEIMENAMAVLRFLGKRIPDGTQNIQSIHLKTPDSIALPIFVRGSEPKSGDNDNN